MVFWLVHASIIDDSYITLTYARNLGLHGHWGLIAEQTSNTATSPLNVLLLGALTALLRHPVWALGVLFVVANMALAAALLRVMRALSLPAWGAVAAWLAVLLNPLLLSAVGLEVALGAAVLALMLMAAVESRPWVFGVCAGLAVLTRFDLAIVVVVLFAASRSLWRGWWKAVVAAGMVAGPWFVFSWVVLGSFVPDTLLIKTQQRSWGGHQFGEGPLLLLRFYPAAIVLAFLPAVLGVLAFAAWTRRRAQLSLPAAFGLGGILHYLAYTILGVPPYHWYYGPSLICLSLFAALAASAVARGFALAAVFLVVCQLGFAVQHGLPWRMAAVTTNWASPAQYATVGRDLKALVGDQPVRLEGEIGAIAYFCDCTVLDQFSDRTQLVSAIDTVTAQAGPVKQWLLRLNYHFLDRGTPQVTPRYVLRDVATPPSGVPAWPATSPWHGPGAPPDGYYALFPA
ncbi:hypothetical protein [Amycolatopsis tucumanensis]|uniref:DUF2029 domain-containing protein n=1 Tax=Amycolatopsis tucumanensis TaxID=401106 RepID=A0ABP7IFT6_9PSEU|nr:hypothetical protein [Amycolatopsis tucumanensis]MCF6423975.1 hypothetical protein [Amycolatopsis tucumanensis]